MQDRVPKVGVGIGTVNKESEYTQPLNLNCEEFRMTQSKVSVKQQETRIIKIIKT